MPAIIFKYYINIYMLNVARNVIFMPSIEIRSLNVRLQVSVLILLKKTACTC